MIQAEEVQVLYHEVIENNSSQYSKNQNIHRTNGKKIIKILSSQNIESLSAEELNILAYAYHWVGLYKNAVRVSLKYIVSSESSTQPSIEHEVYISSMYPDSTYLSKKPYIKMIKQYSSYIQSNIGSKVIWSLLISYLYIELAYIKEGIYSDSIPNTTKVYHPNYLEFASEYLHKALKMDFDLVLSLNKDVEYSFSYSWLEGLYKLNEYKMYRIENLSKSDYL